MKTRLRVQTGFVARSVVTALALLLALLMIGAILIPVSVWGHPTNDAIYAGFDPNLIYVSAVGPGSAPGVVDVSPRAITISTASSSHPTIHLLTTPLTFSASFDLVVHSEGSQTVPFRAGVWSPTTRAGYFIVMDPKAGDVIRAETISGGIPSTDLVGGVVRTNDVLGQYQLGHAIQLNFNIDEARQIISARVVGTDTLPPAGLHALQVGTDQNTVTLVSSSSFPVAAGVTYSVGGWVDNVGARGAHAIGVVWLDKAGRPLASTGDRWWQGHAELTVWTKQSSDVVAPKHAVAAEVFLGVGASSPYMFGGIFFQTRTVAGPNLVPNGAFDVGEKGWKVTTGHANVIRAVNLNTLSSTSTITNNELPELFASFRPSLTVSAWSKQGASSATVADYVITVPSQPSAAALETIRIKDPLAGLLVETLLAASIVLVLVAGAVWLWPTRQRFKRRVRVHTFIRPIPHARIILLVASGAVLYVLINVLLARLSTIQYDGLAAEIWSYVGVKKGVAELYYEPLLVTTAAFSQGSPLHEAVFPYGITSAYFYQLVGLLSLHLAPTTSLTGSPLESLLKAANVLFGLADGALIFLILRRLTVPASAFQSAALFIFCPAVLFVMSVWGSTETISLFFVLASIWLAEGRHPLGAFLMLAAAAFTRPQMMVLSFLLGLVYIRKFGAGSIRSIAWTVIATFIALVPFALSISPSFPIDYVLRTLTYHLANGQADPNYLGLSAGYYSIWTIPLELVGGQHGLNRMWAPSTLQLWGSVSYGHAATAMSVALVLLVGVALLLLKPLSARPANYLPAVAFAMLGWLMFTPGLISRYFVYAIALVIICRPFFRPAAYFAMAGALTVVTLVTAYGHLALDSLGNGTTSSALNPSNNGLSNLVFNVFSDDRFITLGTLSNVIILVAIGARAWQLGRSSDSLAVLAPGHALAPPLGAIEGGLARLRSRAVEEAP